MICLFSPLKAALAANFLQTARIIGPLGVPKMAENLGSGGGTRTPDTRIMIQIFSLLYQYVACKPHFERLINIKYLALALQTKITRFVSIIPTQIIKGITA